MAWDITVKEKVYQRLADDIFFRIYEGTYQLGAKMPTYQEIAHEARSSPETVIEAIRTLRGYGLIEKTRWGNFITSDRKKVAVYPCKSVNKVNIKSIPTRQPLWYPWENGKEVSQYVAGEKY